MNNRGRWRIGAMASAIALLGSLASLEAHALALGRITVQSALGESLRAEIDISDVSIEEAASLRIGVAGAEIFKSAGLEYSAAVAGLDVKLQRRADGRPYLRLSSNRAITEPFVDLILEAKWASGRVTRDYTMLFDPPNLRTNSAAMAAPAVPVLPRAPVTAAVLPPPDMAAPSAPRPPALPVAVAKPKPPAYKAPIAEKIPSTAGVRQVTVKPGDTASKIATQNKPSSVSLDQMLAAMLRGNPEAFVSSNINVMKSGAVLDIPDAQTAAALSTAEAKQLLVAPSKDFNTFRRKLADGAPAAPPDSPDRQIAGKVQAKVDALAQASSSPDKLTLSKGAVQGKSATPAEEQAARDDATRMAELSKNINDSNKLGVPPATGGATAAPGLAVPAPGAGMTTPGALTVPAVTASPGVNAPASPTATAEASVAAASQPVPSASPASATAAPVPAVTTSPAVVPSPAAEVSLMDQVRDNSLLLLGIGALLALLAGVGFARSRKNNKASQGDSSFLDSRLQPDSFFGVSGGRRVDTDANSVVRSSISYSPSQLDAGGDVDPVAEADVYLAYGRDQQAEEILREAMRNYPARLAIQTKLLEILAKRRDNKAFESVAVSAFKLSKAQGAEWSYICELGRELDPSNSMYQGNPSAGMTDYGVSDFMSDSAPPAVDARPTGPASKAAVKLDMDFSLDEGADAPVRPAGLPSAGANSPSKSTIAASSASLPSAVLNLNDLDLDLDLNLDNIPASPVAAPSLGAKPHASAATPAARAPSSEIDFLSEGLDFTPEPYVAPKASKPSKAPVAPEAPITHSGMLEFDLNSLSLDLGPGTGVQAPVPAPARLEEEDPLEIKFLLAEEFRILGDPDGARSLADEVVNKAKGPLKVKAQAFLNSLM
ncbi:MAG: putative transrane protein [Polaromonas sp.]|nr:putative transrane protein [Polaromonas sp.]